MDIASFIAEYTNRMYAGEELDGIIAADHYSALCKWVSDVAGENCPYLLAPLRLQLMHLEALGKVADALRVVDKYKIVIDNNLYIDKIESYFCDMIKARLQRALGLKDIAQQLVEVSERQIRARIPVFK